MHGLRNKLHHIYKYVIFYDIYLPVQHNYYCTFSLGYFNWTETSAIQQSPYILFSTNDQCILTKHVIHNQFQLFFTLIKCDERMTI